MTQLAQLQRALQAHVIAQDMTIAENIHATADISVSTRLQIYSDAYRLRLIEALQSNYPVLCDMLGADDFSTLAQRYLNAFPSQHFSIRWFGDRLAQFVTCDAAYCEASWLRELIQWEWATASAFDAADVALLRVEDLASVASEEWPSLRFEPHPSLQRLTLTTNTVAIVQASIADELPPAPRATPIQTEWMIWRQALTVRYRSLDAAEAAAINALLAHGTFSDICAALAEHADAEQVPLHAASLLKNWITDECLAKQTQ
jgi:hypothetical protein